MDFYSEDHLVNDVKALQNCFKRQIALTKEIKNLDILLKDISKEDRPDMQLFHATLHKKEGILRTLDQLSEEISLRATAIEPYIKSHQFDTDTQLIALKKLWEESYSLLDEVGMQEDFDFLGISDRLKSFRALLQAEFKINEVPLANRQIILPNHCK